jgi:prepilin-type N-terminal cleavage/methylation domain-containing protein
MNILKILKFKPPKLFPIPYFLTPNNGFTLIELLVVFSIIAVLSALGMVSFVSYSRTQQVNQVANNLKLLISQARFNALSSVKTNHDPDGNTVNCGNESLAGYSVNLLGNDRLELNQICTNTNPFRIKLIVLPANLTFTNSAATCTQIHFDSLSSTATGVPTLPCSIILHGYNQDKTISVDVSGNTSVQ